MSIRAGTGLVFVCPGYGALVPGTDLDIVVAGDGPGELVASEVEVHAVDGEADPVAGRCLDLQLATVHLRQSIGKTLSCHAVTGKQRHAASHHVTTSRETASASRYHVSYSRVQRLRCWGGSQNGIVIT